MLLKFHYLPKHARFDQTTIPVVANTSIAPKVVADFKYESLNSYSATIFLRESLNQHPASLYT